MTDSPSNSESTLWMIVETPSPAPSEGEKGGGIYRGGYLGGGDLPAEVEAAGRVPMAVGKLQQNLNQFLRVVGDLFTEAERQAKISRTEGEKEAKAGIELDEIEFSVAVNAEGEVGFWGLAQGKVGGTTEIKLTFRRKEA